MPRTVHTDETREADRRYRREWYARNADHAKGRVIERRGLLKAWMREHRSNIVCSRCLETDPACMDFHHLDPAAKEMSVANAVQNGWSISRLRAEIAKCIVLCSNCHRKLHAAEAAEVRRAA